MSSCSPFNCCVCSRTCTDIDDLQAHIASEHVRHYPFSCEKCAFTHFPTRAIAVAHYKTVHKLNTFYIRERIDADSEINLARIQKLVEESRKGSESRPFSEKAFQNSVETTAFSPSDDVTILSGTKRTMRPLIPRPSQPTVVCPQRKPNLAIQTRRLKRAVTMLKNRQLRQNSSVTSSAIVKTESSVNEANQPISAIGLMVAGNSGGITQECQEPDCQYAAATSKAIKIHVYNYHKLFTCEVCGEQIPGVNDIRRHVIKNHKAELCCPYCSRAYSAKTKLNEHKRKCDKKAVGNRIAAAAVNKKQQDSAHKMSAASSGNSQVSSSTGKKPQPQYMPEDLIRPMLEYIRDHSNYPAYKKANKLGDDGYRIVFDKWDRLCAMLNSSYSHSGYVATPTKLMTKWKNLKERVRKRHLTTRTNPDVRLPKRIILDRNESLVAELLGGWQNDSFDGGDSGMLTIPIENNPFFSAMKQKTVPVKSNDRKVNEEFRLL